MKPTEFSKRVVSKSLVKGWELATAPWRLGNAFIDATAELLSDSVEYKDQRKKIAQEFTELHQQLKSSNSKVDFHLAGETEVYTIRIHSSYQIICYFKRELVGYKVSVEERSNLDNGKVKSVLYGPIFLAEHLGTIRPYQYGSMIGTTPELSGSQMSSLTALLEQLIAELKDHTKSTLGDCLEGA